MSNNVDITFAARDKETQQVIDKMNDRLQKVEARLEKMKKVSKEASTEASTGFSKSNEVMGRMSATITGAISGLLSMRAAVRAIGEEWDATAKKQNAVRMASLDPAMALRSAIFAMEDDATVTGATLESKLTEIAKKNKVDFGIAARVFEQASSAKGSGTNQDVINAMEASFAKGVTNESEAATLAIRNLNLSKVSGTTDMAVNMGIQQELGSASMVKDFEAIGESLVPAVIGLTKLGATVEEASELVSATTHMITDKEGDVAARSIQILAQQVMSFQPERETKGKFRGKFASKDAGGEFAVPDSQVDQFLGSDRLMERIKTLQESPELQRAFMSRMVPGSLHLPTKGEESLRGLLRGDEREVLELQKAQQSIIGPATEENQAKLAAKFRDKISIMDSTQLNQALEFEQQQKSAQQLAMLRDSTGRRAAEAREALTQTLDNVDLPGFDTVFRKAIMPAFETSMKKVVAEGGTPEFAAARALELTPIRAPKGDPFADDMSPEDIAELDEAIERMKNLGRKRGPIQSAESRATAGTGQRDPQMDEQTQVLKEISTKLSPSAAPRQTERPASRVSRGAN